jgi:hypothetical protein
MQTWAKRALILVGCGGLLLTGPCVQITERSLISGLFNAATAILVQWLEAQLGLAGSS